MDGNAAPQPAQTDYVFYERRSGRIVQAGSVETIYLELQAALVPPGCAMLLAKVENVDAYRVRDGALVADVVAISLEEERATADRNVRVQAEIERARFISPGTGKAMAYQQKAAEADRFLVDEAPVADRYPHVYGEAEAIGITPASMAAMIVRLRDQWQRASAAIERIERAAILAVQAASSFDELRTAQAVDWSAVDELAQSEISA